MRVCDNILKHAGWLLLFIVGFGLPSLAEHRIIGVHPLLSNAEDKTVWIFFNSPDEAIQAAIKFEKELWSVISNKPPRPFLPSTDRRYPAVRKLMREVWEAFQQSHPNLTTDLPTPQIVLVNDDSKTAHAMNDIVKEKTLWAISYNTGLLTLPEDQQFAILAHELTHALLRHAATRKKRPNRYFLAARHESPELDQPNDPALERDIEDRSGEMKMTGLATSPELLDLPTFGEIPLYTRMLTHVIGTKIDVNKPECQQLIMTSTVWERYVMQKYSLIHGRMILAPAEKQTLRNLSERYLDNLRGCLGKMKYTIVDYLVELVKLPRNQIEALLNTPQFTSQRAELTIFEDAGNFVDGLTRTVNKSRKKIANIESRWDMSRVRFFSDEDEADNFSLRASKAKHKNTEALVNFLLGLLPVGERQSCEEMIQHGQVPPFGSLADDHHSECYRIWRIRALARKM
jgi:hypothetical protein